MNFAINKTLVSKNLKCALLIGTDCPAMTYDYLNNALHLLSDGTELVLGPAEDGGYVLIGMNKSYSELFQGIKWGGDEVLEKTIQKAKKIGVDFMIKILILSRIYHKSAKFMINLSHFYDKS